MENKPAGQKRLSVWRISRYAFLGVPISLRHLKMPWKDVSTPRFPFLFSLLPLLMAIVIGSITGPWAIEDVYVSQDEFILVRIIGFVEAIPYSIIAFIVLFSWIPFVVNLLLLGWCLLVLSVFKSITKKSIQVAEGAQRVIYFSAFFQFVFFILFTCLPGFFINSHSNLTMVSIVFWVTVSILAITRLASIFQGIRRETNGNNFAGFLCILPCIDVWYFMFILSISFSLRLL